MWIWMDYLCGPPGAKAFGWLWVWMFPATQGTAHSRKGGIVQCPADMAGIYRAGGQPVLLRQFSHCRRGVNGVLVLGGSSSFRPALVVAQGLQLGPQ